MSLASIIGRPLKIDAATRTLGRPSVARVCIEVNLLRLLPKRIWIGQGESGFWQSVTYDNLPPYCRTCSKIGHADVDCISSATTLPQREPPVSVWRPKVVPQSAHAAPHAHSSGLTSHDKTLVPVDVSPQPDAAEPVPALPVDLPEKDALDVVPATVPDVPVPQTPTVLPSVSSEIPALVSSKSVAPLSSVIPAPVLPLLAASTQVPVSILTPESHATPTASVANLPAEISTHPTSALLPVVVSVDAPALGPSVLPPDGGSSSEEVDEEICIDAAPASPTRLSSSVPNSPTSDVPVDGSWVTNRKRKPYQKRTFGPSSMVTRSRSAPADVSND